MESKYKRDLNHTYLILELPVLYEEDYQMKMMQANRIERFLPLSGQGVGENSQYFYEISEKIPMKSLYGKAELEEEELKKFLRQFQEALGNAQRYLLNINRILLAPEYIFCGGGEFYFCYLPVHVGEIWQEFHSLTEYFVSRVSHNDERGMFLAYELHKATMEENYNLEKIMGRLCTEEKKIAEDTKKEAGYTKKEVSYIKTEEQEEAVGDDWIDYEETAADVVKESPVRWGSIRKKKKRVGKWGDWGG